MWIDVTAEDIASGRRGSSGRCPIALACTRQIHRHTAVSTSELIISKSLAVEWHDRISLRLPDAARYFVHSFDSYQLVQPFRFEVDLPFVVVEPQAAEAEELVPA